MIALMRCAVCPVMVATMPIPLIIAMTQFINLVMRQTSGVNNGLCKVNGRRKDVIRQTMTMYGAVIQNHRVQRERLIINLNPIRCLDLDFVAAMVRRSRRAEAFLVAVMSRPEPISAWRLKIGQIKRNPYTVFVTLLFRHNALPAMFFSHGKQIAEHSLLA